MSRLHALSVDVEEWYHPELVRRRVPAAERRSLAAQACRPLLDLLDRHATKATFFLVGEVIAALPELAQEIAGRGHEIGCHTYSHTPLWEMTPAALAGELERWRRALQDAVGDVPVAGFRAPTFSLDEGTAWALDVLADAGYRYDSSLFPFRTYLYGVAGAPLAPYRISPADVRVPSSAGRLVEFPMSVWRRGRLTLPISGGIYLRLLPAPALRTLLRAAAVSRPLVVYVHPWEASMATPRVRLPATQSLATYANRGSVLPKLESLLRCFSFAPLRIVLQREGLLEIGAGHAS